MKQRWRAFVSKNVGHPEFEPATFPPRNLTIYSVGNAGGSEIRVPQENQKVYEFLKTSLPICHYVIQTGQSWN